MARTDNLAWSTWALFVFQRASFAAYCRQLPGKSGAWRAVFLKGDINGRLSGAI